MTLISYAQNCEDIMLWRALKNVKTGFYIDIGAAWPEYDSVTKLFYDQGWHGLNVEPNPDLFEQLKQDRPLDTNLCLAVGDRSGVQVMNFLSNQGLSTLNEEIAQKHIDAGWLCHRKEVEVKKLTDIWNLNIPTGTEVHFLKIDVEGQEKAVLKGSDWSCLRPWIVLLESTLPMSQTENHHEWESILIEADYQFAYADGINRFYVAKEHSELLIFFKHPPNFFDNFIHKSIKQSAETTAQLESQIQQILASSNAKVDLLTSELKGVVEDLNSSRNASVQLKEQLSDDIKIVKGITDQIKAELVININTLMTNAEELKNNLNCEMKKVKDVTEFFKTEISADLNASRNIAAELKKNLNNEIQAVKDVTDRLKTEIVTDITTSRSVATKLKEELNKDIALIKDVTVHLKTEIANEINEVKLITANLKEEIYKDMNISRYSSAQLKHELFKDIHTVRNIQEQRRRELENVYQSLSWRLTYPLREGNRLVKVAQALSISFLKAKGQKTKTQLRPVLLKTILFIKRRPFLYRKSMLLLKSFPQFSDKLRGVYIRNLVTKPPFFPSNYLEERIIKSSNGQVTECGNDPRLARLSQPARRLYIELNSAALKSKGI